MKNSFSLTSILGIILLATVSFGGVCSVFLLDVVLEKGFTQKMENIAFGGVLFFTTLLLFISIGVFAKAKWARVLLLWLLYITLGCSSLVFFLNIEEASKSVRSFLPYMGIASLGYSFLLGAVMFLHNKAVKAEFGVAEIA